MTIKSLQFQPSNEVHEPFVWLF